METVHDFEDLLELLDRFGARSLIIGGLAFPYHAMPRYTKDMDLWIAADPENVARTNRALQDFGSPDLLDQSRGDEILQIGVAPTAGQKWSFTNILITSYAHSQTQDTLFTFQFDAMNGSAPAFQALGG